MGGKHGDSSGKHGDMGDKYGDMGGRHVDMKFDLFIDYKDLSVGEQITRSMRMLQAERNATEVRIPNMGQYYDMSPHSQRPSHAHAHVQQHVEPVDMHTPPPTGNFTVRGDASHSRNYASHHTAYEERYPARDHYSNRNGHPHKGGHLHRESYLPRDGHSHGDGQSHEDSHFHKDGQLPRESYAPKNGQGHGYTQQGYQRGHEDSRRSGPRHYPHEKIYDGHRGQTEAATHTHSQHGQPHTIGHHSHAPDMHQHSKNQYVQGAYPQESGTGHTDERRSDGNKVNRRKMETRARLSQARDGDMQPRRDEDFESHVSRPAKERHQSMQQLLQEVAVSNPNAFTHHGDTPSAHREPMDSSSHLLEVSPRAETAASMAPRADRTEGELALLSLIRGEASGIPAPMPHSAPRGDQRGRGR